jgi:hypothetical protein
MKGGLLDGDPLGTVAFCHQNGWIQADILLVDEVHERTFNALLAGWTLSHTKGISAMDVECENGIVMLYFLLHSAHKMQPHDMGFMGPLSKSYNRNAKAWLRNNLGRMVTQLHISKIFVLAYPQPTTLKTANSAFIKTGIYPKYPSVMKDAYFFASETTERTLHVMVNLLLNLPAHCEEFHLHVVQMKLVNVWVFFVM